MTPRAKFFTLVMLAVLAAGFVHLRSLARRVFEPPQHGEEAARTKLSEVALQSNTSASQTAILFFPSYDEGKLVVENRPISWAASDTDRVRQVLLALVEGSRQGRSRVLPPATDLRAVFLTTEGTAYIDFSNEGLADLAPGIQSECLAVYAMVNSLAANVPSVKKVKILIQGQEVETLDGHADLSDYFVPDSTPLAATP